MDVLARFVCAPNRAFGVSCWLFDDSAGLLGVAQLNDGVEEVALVPDWLEAVVVPGA